MEKAFFILRIIGVAFLVGAFSSKLLYSIRTWTFIFYGKNDDKKEKERIKKIFYIQVMLGILGVLLIVIGGVPALL